MTRILLLGLAQQPSSSPELSLGSQCWVRSRHVNRAIICGSVFPPQKTSFSFGISDNHGVVAGCLRRPIIDQNLNVTQLVT